MNVEWYIWVMRAFLLIYVAYDLGQELIAIITAEGWRNKLKEFKNWIFNFWNSVAYTANILTVWVIVQQCFMKDASGIDSLINFSAFAICFTWFRMLYFLRLYEEVGFYVRMIM